MIKFMHWEGKFTWGQKYVCFRRPHYPWEKAYVNLCQRPDEMSEEDWEPLAAFITDQLNKYKIENTK
jgi:hypothetical protein